MSDIPHPSARPPSGRRMCADCTYWDRGYDAQGNPLDYGQCRRNPPAFGAVTSDIPVPPEEVVKISAAWPWSRVGDWCGEYVLG
jgi:hypothetical protein